MSSDAELKVHADLIQARILAPRLGRPPNEPFVSHACEFPADQQAVLIPGSMKRRHPWIGHRPEYSGYCVIDTCACECHQAQPGELAKEVRLDAFES